MDQQELDRIHAERHGYFTPKWFGRLMRGELSLGDTFWIGNYGVALVTVPAAFLIAMLAKIVSEQTYLTTMMVVAVAFALYHLALTRAVWITARRAPGRGGWRWVGLFITALNAALAIVLLGGWAETLGLI
ncbi:MAG: hypothetical protein CSA72_12020 [Rhodobacterales bacterium]|nr:MAG: hypothetical protein CSA72_12020 [Rhodobacterales bacterium]